jgi:hypothetical protein
MSPVSTSRVGSIPGTGGPTGPPRAASAAATSCSRMRPASLSVDLPTFAMISRAGAATRRRCWCAEGRRGLVTRTPCLPLLGTRLIAPPGSRQAGYAVQPSPRLSDTAGPETRFLGCVSAGVQRPGGRRTSSARGDLPALGRATPALAVTRYRRRTAKKPSAPTGRSSCVSGTPRTSNPAASISASHVARGNRPHTCSSSST